MNNKPKGTGIYLTPEFYNSKAWHDAGLYGQKLFIDLFNGLTWDWIKKGNKKVKEYNNHDQLGFTQVEFCKKYGCMNETYTRARNRCIYVGLISMTHKGGNGRGDYSTYKLLYHEGRLLTNNDQQRWMLYDGEKKNWGHEIPTSKHRIGMKTQFQKGESGRTRKKISTLTNDTLNGANPPIEKDTYNEGAY